jgi:2-dehydro-3-deoxygalactonokinase
MMTDGPTNMAAFDRGVARSADPGHLLHHLFGVRTLGLTGKLADNESASYLSGLLIGHEVRAAHPQGLTVHLIGAGELCALYARAIVACGGEAVIEDEDAAARGLALIGRSAAWN